MTQLTFQKNTLELWPVSSHYRLVDQIKAWEKCVLRSTLQLMIWLSRGNPSSRERFCSVQYTVHVAKSVKLIYWMNLVRFIMFITKHGNIRLIELDTCAVCFEKQLCWRWSGTGWYPFTRKKKIFCKVREYTNNPKKAIETPPKQLLEKTNR